MATKGYKVINLTDADDNTTSQVSEAHLANVSDEEIIERLRERFEILEDMTRAVKAGNVRAMIVSGAPGVGKSFGVEKVLSKHDTFAQLADDQKLKKYEIIKGSMSPIGLYKKLFDFSDKKSILVLDDCDHLMVDEVALNILKGALDSSKKRVINWLTDSRSLAQEGVPNTFEFKGGMIFITNLKFSNVRSQKLKDHLAAIESRCHYLDLTIDTAREKMLRIKQIVQDGMLDDYNFTDQQKADILEFIETNRHSMRELSLRTVIKTAEIVKSMPDRWQRVAAMTLMK